MPRTIKAILRLHLNIITLVLGSAALTACNGFLQPHKMSIQQGNIVTKDMLDKLKVGMTPKQVHYVLGTPLLVDTFANDDWHYVYYLRLGSGRTLQQKLSLAFSAGKLDAINTDYNFDENAAEQPGAEVQNEASLATGLADAANSASGK
ncbi:MAG: outer membrane protein assembly factor BamE [Gammaproteobacteria bacterium]|nr:outer membrane protein assembly factor BamE [Gammaproteobacteria bacterium]